MELIGEVLMKAPREQVWDALNDTAVLQACIPGCEEVVEESPTVRKARVMVKMGPVRARFNGKVTLSEVLPPERCLMAFEGSGGAAGMASGRSQVELHDHGGDTRLTYTVKASVGGKLGQIGGRMMDASAKQLADQFFEALRAHLSPANAEIEAGVTQESPPSQPAAVLAGSSQSTEAAAVQPAPPAARAIDRSPVLWFLLGVASTALGVWLGARLF